MISHGEKSIRVSAAVAFLLSVAALLALSSCAQVPSGNTVKKDNSARKPRTEEQKTRLTEEEKKSLRNADLWVPE